MCPRYRWRGVGTVSILQMAEVMEKLGMTESKRKPRFPERILFSERILQRSLGFWVGFNCPDLFQCMYLLILVK